METRRLGNSDMEITRIGLGTWAIGGAGYAFGWGPQDDRDSIRTIEEAVGEGINWIDTAPIYGFEMPRASEVGLGTSLPNTSIPLEALRPGSPGSLARPGGRRPPGSRPAGTRGRRHR